MTIPGSLEGTGVVRLRKQVYLGLDFLLSVIDNVSQPLMTAWENP